MPVYLAADVGGTFTDRVVWDEDANVLAVQKLFNGPSKFSDISFDAGDAFISVQGGGGGYGSAARRNADRVNPDLEGGYSVEHARSHYAEQLACHTGTLNRGPAADPGLGRRGRTVDRERTVAGMVSGH